MTNDDHNERLKSRIREAMATLDTDATGLARILGRGKDYVRDFLEGRKRTIDGISLQIIEREIRERATGRMVESAVTAPLPPSLSGDRDFPLYSAAEGGSGEMIVSSDPIEMVQRPWVMREVRDGFAVLVTGDSMDPAFEPGDLAIVNPRLPVLRNKDAIFTSSDDFGQGEVRAVIKRYLKADGQRWHVRQFNEPRDFDLSKREWPRALRVVGKLSSY